MSGDRYISQNALIKEIAKIHGNLNTKNVGQAIWDTPTADVVEVVRCEKCRHYHAEKGGWCERHDFEFDVGDYCCHGERREE